MRTLPTQLLLTSIVCWMNYEVQQSKEYKTQMQLIKAEKSQTIVLVY